MSRQYNNWYFSLSDEEREEVDAENERAALIADNFYELEVKIKELEAENKKKDRIIEHLTDEKCKKKPNKVVVTKEYYFN